jgi:hypothetical protein
VNEQNPQPTSTQQPTTVFWRDVARNVITAIIVAVLLAIPITKIGQWIVKAVVPKEPLRIQTDNVELKFPENTNSPRVERYVKFDTPFTRTPQVNAHYTVFNQGVDEHRNYSFGVTAAETTPQGFHLTATGSYPGATGTVEWLAVGE